MTKREMVKALRSYIPEMEQVAPEYPNDDPYRSVFIGTFMALDPCGRYHHILSPNGITSRCERYWENLEAAANELGGWIEDGEGDPCDQYFCLPADEKVTETK